MPHGSKTVSAVTTPVGLSGGVDDVVVVDWSGADPGTTMIVVFGVASGSVVMVGSSDPADITFSPPATQADSSKDAATRRRGILGIAASVDTGIEYSR